MYLTPNPLPFSDQTLCHSQTKPSAILTPTFLIDGLEHMWQMRILVRPAFGHLRGMS